MTRTRRAYGTWPSPIMPALLAEATRFGEVEWSPDGRRLVWLEGRSGTSVLLGSNLDGNAPWQVTSGLSVRARVGYGGGNFTLGTTHVYFVADNGRLYRQALTAEPAAAHSDTGEPHALVPPGIRCASPALSPDEQWLAYVYEVEGENGLAIVDTEGRNWPRRLAGGHDFYAWPVWHPDGRELAWVCWDHPRMPWDGTELHVQVLAASSQGPIPEGVPVAVAGGPEESVLQPAYAPDGSGLAFLSDREGWFRLYLLGREHTAAPACLTTEDAEYGGPAWQQDMRWHAWLPGGEGLAVLRGRDAATTLLRVSTLDGTAEPMLPVDSGYTDFARPVANPTDGRVALVASGDRIPPRIVVCAPSAPPGAEPAGRPGRTTPRPLPMPAVVARSAPEHLPAGMLAELRPVSWHSNDGSTVHGLFAAPTHSVYQDAAPPPLVVSVHGGPTGQAVRAWRPEVQFFTSRGYAFLDVNHRGSSGYGRKYRNLLAGQWGVLDVADAVGGARHVADQGWADGSRMAIRGSSAGGYTVLRALTTYPEVFRAAICLYGISDLLALARETHKFEAHYTDTLVGPLPQAAERYRERSPLYQADRIVTPLLLFQGEDDEVVPPAQAEALLTSLRSRGVPHEYHRFAGEGHGFRRRETVLALWQAIERFLQMHLVFA